MKGFQFASFAAAVAFVNRVARVADAANHHPDLDVRGTRVICYLSTPSVGGITQRDLDLAAAIERVAPA